ncbi:MAG TPA: ribonuclease HII [Syntrophaceae bacterium]|nr:ribonuclease HII [Syntrophaceae bacterium]
MGAVLGIDEAGRGCVIGPMVICGVLADEEADKLLAQLGIKDSKQLSPIRRDALRPHILSIIRNHKLVEVEPFEIDQSVETSGLNVLEAHKMAAMIAHFQPSKAIVDAPGRGESYGKLLSHLLPGHIEIVSQNHADKTYPVVSAASILAKLRRDELIGHLHQEYGDFGSGYSFDKKTIAFLKVWCERHHALPKCVRTSWKTVKRLANMTRHPMFKE